MFLRHLFRNRLWLSLGGAVLLVALFQNCGGTGGFSTLSQGTTDLGSSGTSVQTPSQDSGDATPTPMPTSTPAATLKKTYFYFGRTKGIDSFELDPTTGVLRQLTATTFTGASVGWLSHEPTSNSILAVDAGGSVLQIYSQATATGALSSVQSLNNFAASVVHLNLQPTSTGFDLFAASYDRGVLDYYKMNATKTQVAATQSVSFGSTAKTHSSAFDSKRSLLYVANLGLNRIDVYKYSTTGLTALQTIALEGARSLVYDSTYDKLYASTEVYTGNSFIRIFAISGAAGPYTFTDAGSLAMPLSGGDLKVNHAFGYVMATARETGKEAILGLPITDQGVEDKTRTSFSIPVTQALPRALELTEDGLYAVVGMNSATAENIVAYKMSFDAQKKYLSSQKIFQSRIDTTQGYLCGLSLPSTQ